MSARLLTAEAEILEPTDFDAMTLFPRDQIDDLVEDAIAYPAHWSRFTVGADANAQVVKISAGRYHEGRLVYESEAVINLNLQAYLPLVVSDERWVALILRGTVETESESRPFKDTAEDADDGSVVMRSTPHIERRRVGIAVQQGLASPAPSLVPVVADTDCCIAFVRLKTSGVQEIVASNAHRVKTLYEVEGRVTAIEVQLAALFIRTSALESDFANLNAKVNALPITRPEIIRQMRRDIAALRIKGEVPAGARTDFYDPGLLPDQWDFTHASANFRVNEGVQFPFVQVQNSRMEIVNEDDPKLTFRGRRMMPAFSEIKRIANEGGGTSKNIANIIHTVTTAVQRSVARSSVSYGPTINACENSAEWSKYSQSQYAGASFTIDGKQFEGLGLAIDYTAEFGAGHNIYASREVQYQSWTETYWDYATETFGFNGAVRGQTFLVSQPLVATSIEVQFSKVGAELVHMFLCETDATGAPIIDKVLARTTLTAAELAVGGAGWKTFPIPLTYLTPGRRYAWFTVTTGNHELYGTSANAFTGGTSFSLTDGAWAQGDLDFDFNFRVNGARFANARTVIQFAPMTLPGGMTEFRLLYSNWVPDGTALEWEIRPFYGNGVDSPWSRLVKAEENPLTNLPALVELRCTMLSTQDLAPMIELDANAVVRTARVGNTFQAVTKALNLGLTATTFQTLIYLDDFDDDVHNFVPRIMAGPNVAGITNTLIAPSVSTMEVIDRPEHVAVLSTYTMPAGTTAVRIAPGGNSSSITDIFFIQNVAGFAL